MRKPRGEQKKFFFAWRDSDGTVQIQSADGGKKRRKEKKRGAGRDGEGGGAGKQVRAARNINKSVLKSFKKRTRQKVIT